MFLKNNSLKRSLEKEMAKAMTADLKCEAMEKSMEKLGILKVICVEQENQSNMSRMKFLEKEKVRGWGDE